MVEALAVNRLNVLLVRFDCGFLDLVFAFEPAIDEAGEGVEEAEAVEGTVFHGFLEAFGSEVDDGLADLGDGDFRCGLVAGEAFGAAGEVECEFVSEFAFFEALLVFEPVAVAAEFFPCGDVVGSEGGQK